MVVAVVTLLALIVVMLGITIFTAHAAKDGLNKCVCVGACAVGGAVLALILGASLATGTLDTDNNNKNKKNGELKTNAIYEVVSAGVVTQDKETKVAVILKKQNGDLVAYLLDRMPPKIFKKTKDPNNPYQAYPPEK